jgi:hypothetical protein
MLFDLGSRGEAISRDCPNFARVNRPEDRPNSRSHPNWHWYAFWRYHVLTGFKAPADGGPTHDRLKPADRAALDAARLSISRVLGATTASRSPTPTSAVGGLNGTATHEISGRPLRSGRLRMTLTGREDLARDLFNLESVRLTIIARGREGFADLTIRPSRPVHLRHTAAAKALTEHLEKNGFKVFWEPYVLEIEGRRVEAPEMKILWEPAND